MNKWEFRFLDLAKFYAGWSKDPSTKVGAVIIQGKNNQVSQGYNGLPTGILDTVERLRDRETRLKLTIHAEANSMYFSNPSNTQGATIYISAPPCVPCTSAVIQMGIKSVVCIEGTPSFLERWGDDVVLSKEILEETHISYKTFSEEEYREEFKKQKGRKGCFWE